MILADDAIRRALDTREIIVKPSVHASDIRGTGLRVHLGADLLIPVMSEEVDAANPTDEHFMKLVMDDGGYRLGSGDFVLACTTERVQTSRSLGCSLDGRSSIARLGLFVHCSSAAIDNIHGEPRVIVLELYNCSGRALRLRPGLAIAMLSFFRLEGTITQSASPQYADQQTALPPRPGETAP